MRAGAVLCISILALVCGPVSASWVRDKSFNEKARDSDVVLVGRVLARDIRLEGNPNSRAASFEVETVFVDRAGTRSIAVGQRILFVHAFGSVEQDDLTCCDLGNRYLLFLRRVEGRADRFVSANGPHGAYMLERMKPKKSPGKSPE